MHFTERKAERRKGVMRDGSLANELNRKLAYVEGCRKAVTELQRKIAQYQQEMDRSLAECVEMLNGQKVA